MDNQDAFEDLKRLKKSKHNHTTSTSEAHKDLDSFPSEALFVYDDIVTVHVGPNKQAFKIHKSLICRYSTFFRAALTNSFAEASTLSVTLPAQDPEVFKLFVYWLYTGNINNPTCHPDCKSKQTSKQWSKTLETEYVKYGLRKDSQPDLLPYDNEVRELYEMDAYRAAPFGKIVELYVLADYLQVTFIRDLIITKLIMVYGDTSPPKTEKTNRVRFWHLSRLPLEERPAELPYPGPAIAKAWSQLPESDPLCKVLVLLYCDNCITARETLQHADRDDNAETLHPKFLEACFDEAQRRWREGERRTDWLSGESICRWHSHGGAFATILKLSDYQDGGPGDAPVIMCWIINTQQHANRCFGVRKRYLGEATRSRGCSVTPVLGRNK